MIRLKFIAYGNRKEVTNPFHWKEVVCNLPGTPTYDSTKPWVMKVRPDGYLALEI